MSATITFPKQVVNANTPITIDLHPLDVADRVSFSARKRRWTELFDCDPAARISQHPEHVLAELTQFAAESSAGPMSSPLVLCEASQGGQLVALGILVAKRMTTRQAGGFGLRKEFAGYRLAGNRFLGNVGDGLRQRMLAACATFAREQHAAFLLIEDVEQSDPLFAAADALQSNGYRLFCPRPMQNRWKIEFPSQADDYWKKFSSKTRNTFRRKQKKIGASRLVRITEASQVAELLNGAHAISQHTWQSRKLGLRIRNDESEARLFTFLATRQALRSYLLFVEDQPAAFLIGTQFNGLFSYEEVGYDRRLADRSAGHVLLLRVLDDLLHDNPPSVFDFGGGDAPYKRLLATTPSISGSIWLVPPAFWPQLWVTYLRGCHWTEHTVRSVVRKIGLTTLLRQFVRGKRASVVQGSESGRSATCEKSGDGGAA